MAAPPKDYPLFVYITNKEAIMIACFVGGYMDAVGYICLHGLFTASITGNIVNAVIPIYKDNVEGFLPRFAVWVAIAAGAWMTTSFSMKIRFVTLLNKWQVGMVLFGCEIVALLFALSIGSSLNYPHIDTWQTMLAGVLMAYSMGVQNSAAMVMIPNCPPTTAMTGNSVRMGIYAAEACDFYLASQNYIPLYPPKAGKPFDYDSQMRKNSEEMYTKFIGSFSAVSSFTIGCMVGASLAFQIGMGSIFVPVLIITCLVVNIHFAERIASADMAKNGTNIVEMQTVEAPIFKQMAGGNTLLQDENGSAKSEDGEPESNLHYHPGALEATYDGGAHQTPHYDIQRRYSVFTDGADENLFIGPDELPDESEDGSFTLQNLSTNDNEEIYRL